MKLEVDYSRIFFCKYSLSEDEKKNSAKYIMEKVLSEITENFTIDNMAFTVEPENVEKEIEIIKTIKLLKEEFFLFVKNEDDKVLPLPVRDKAEDYIYKNSQYEHLTPQYVCDKLNLNRKNTDAMFIEKHNMTMREFIMYVRVEKAKTMLSDGLNSCQCAECAGFGSVKTMQRAFKNVCGKTPMEYKACCLDSKECE